MTAATFVDCKCGHSKTLHPERNDEACRVQTCECEEYRPKTLDDPRPPAPSQPARPTTPAPAGVVSLPTAEQTITAGKRSEAKRIRGLAEKIETQLADLGQRLRDERQAAAEKRRADAEAEKVRAEIERLETELAAAKAKARPTRTPPRAKSTGDGVCPDCGKTGLSNVGVHRSKSHGYRKAG